MLLIRDIIEIDAGDTFILIISMAVNPLILYRPLCIRFGKRKKAAINILIGNMQVA